MRWLLFVWCVLPHALPAVRAQDPPPFRLPAEVRCRAGEIVLIVAATEAASVRWKCFDPLVSLLDGKALADPKSVALVARKPGTFTVWAWTAIDNRPSDLVGVRLIVVDGPEPAPPEDDLKRDLLAAWHADAGTPEGKRLCRRLLVELYRQAVPLAADAEIETAGRLLKILREAGAGLAKESLVGVRERLARQLRTVLPVDPDTRLDDAARKLAAASFERFALILEELP